jgi:anthranilate synthase component 2
MHGKVSRVYHDGTSVFAGLPSPLHATRYHSLVVRPETLPPTLRAIAHTRDAEGRPDEVMAVAHRTHPVVGVQFHPESALTEYGYAMLDRFLRGDAARPAALPARADMATPVPDESGAGEEPAFVPPPVGLVR